MTFISYAWAPALLGGLLFLTAGPTMGLIVGAVLSVLSFLVYLEERNSREQEARDEEDRIE